MMKLEFKSAAIGFLSATTLLACLATSNQPESEVGRYQFIGDDPWEPQKLCFDTKLGAVVPTEMIISETPTRVDEYFKASDAVGATTND